MLKFVLLKITMMIIIISFHESVRLSQLSEANVGNSTGTKRPQYE